MFPKPTVLYSCMTCKKEIVDGDSVYQTIYYKESHYVNGNFVISPIIDKMAIYSISVEHVSCHSRPLPVPIT